MNPHEITSTVNFGSQFWTLSHFSLTHSLLLFNFISQLASNLDYMQLFFTAQANIPTHSIFHLCFYFLLASCLLNNPHHPHPHPIFSPLSLPYARCLDIYFAFHFHFVLFTLLSDHSELLSTRLFLL